MPSPDYFAAAGKQKGIDPVLLQALAQVESNDNPNATSPAGAQGLMQIMPQTAASLGVQNPYDPAQAVPGAADYLAQGYKATGSPAGAVAYYHGGPNEAEWGPKTQQYVAKVAQVYQQLKNTRAPADAGAEAAGGAPAATPQAAPSADAIFSQWGVGAGTPTPTAPSGAAPVQPAPAPTQATTPNADDIFKAWGVGAPAQAASAPSSGAQAPPQASGTPVSAGVPEAAAPQPAQSPATGTQQGTPMAAAIAADKAEFAKDHPWLSGALNTATGAVNALTHGLSMGLDEPVAAGERAIADRLDPKGAASRDALDQTANNDQAQFVKDHPVVNAAGEIAGSLPTYLLGENALVKASPVFRGGLLARAGNGAITLGRNALMGGLSGYGLSEGNDASAGTGAVLGAVLPPAFGIAGAVANRIAPAVIGQTARGAANVASRKVAAAIARDGMTPAQVASNLASLGPNAALVDAGGANMRNLGEKLANMPGQAAQAAQEFLENRAAAQAARLHGAVTAATGSTGDFHAAVDQLAQQRAAAASPLYEKAFSTPITRTDVRPVQAMIQDPIGQDALGRGMRIIQLEKLAKGETFDPALYGVKRGESGAWIIDPGQSQGPNGQFGPLNKAPGLRLMDAVKRGYDDIVEDFRDPVTNRLNLNQYGRAVNSVRAAYVAKLRNLSPDYAAALDAWGGPSQSMDALAMGRRALDNDPEVTTKAIANLSPGDKDFFKAGVARAIKDKIDSTQDGADATRRIFGNTLIRDRIAAAFDDPQAFDQFQKTMGQESVFANTRNQVLKGSPTSRREAAQRDDGIDIAGPILHLAHGNYPGAAMNVFQQALTALSRPTAQEGARMGDMLFTPGANAGTLSNLQAANSNPLLRAYLARVGIVGGNNLLALPSPQPSAPRN